MADFGRFPGFVAVQKAFGTSMLFRGFRGFRWKNPPLEGKNAWRASKLVVPQSRDLLHFVGPLGFPFSRALWATFLGSAPCPSSELVKPGSAPIHEPLKYEQGGYVGLSTTTFLGFISFVLGAVRSRFRLPDLVAGRSASARPQRRAASARAAQRARASRGPCAAGGGLRRGACASGVGGSISIANPPLYLELSKM